jgi:TRAP-type C4-dicarboxylate transport system permease small subunit
MDLRLPLRWFYAVAAVGASVAALLCVVRLVRLVQGREDELAPVPVEEIEAAER